MSVGKDTPNVTWGVQEDYKKLYWSEPEAALKIPITIAPGYGVLKMGQAIARNTSAAGNGGLYVPYIEVDNFDGTEIAAGRTYILVDGADNTTVVVRKEDSYRFVVGDNLFVIDRNTAAEDLGAITAIDRTSHPTRATITTTANNPSSMTVSEFAYVYVAGAGACVGIQEKSVTAGEGRTAAGANSVMIVSNAIVYKGMLVNLDNTARTAIGATHVGQFTIIK